MKNNWLITLLLISLSATGCRNEPNYAGLVAQELARAAQVDQLVLGLHFNMPMETFFRYCFEMNQQGLFFQNQGDAQVLYTYQEEFGTPVDFVFFPVGGHQSIQELEGAMTYQSWAPFTRDFTAEKLQQEVIRYFEKELGGRSFIPIDHPLQYWPKAYVKLDANRKILLYRSFDDRQLHIVFENLRAKS